MARKIIERLQAREEGGESSRGGNREIYVRTSLDHDVHV